MKIHTFADGHKITSKLDAGKVMESMRRLDILRVLTEGYTEGEGLNICKKALNAYNKTDNYTGIIHLTFLEKDFLGYCLEGDCITDEERKVIKYYTGC